MTKNTLKIGNALFSDGIFTLYAKYAKNIVSLKLISIFRRSLHVNANKGVNERASERTAHNGAHPQISITKEKNIIITMLDDTLGNWKWFW